MRTSSVFRVVEGDLKAVWRDNVGSLTYILNLKNDNSNKFELSSEGMLSTSSSMPSSFITFHLQNILSQSSERIREIMTNRTKPLLTLFTSWNDSQDKYLVHNITSVNWLSLRPFVVPVVFTNESAVIEACNNSGWMTLPVRVAAAEGVPVLKYMYIDAMKKIDSDFYAYSNSDILFTDTLIKTLFGVLAHNSSSEHHTFIIGKRTNVDNVTMVEGSSWIELAKVAKKRGKVFTGYAEDYFITSSSYPWKDIPEVVIGRRAYDNWLVLNARKQKHHVIDASDTILAVHQTTKAGNFEGHGHKNGEYNHKLLAKLYKSIRYGSGELASICSVLVFSGTGAPVGEIITVRPYMYIFDMS
ncbi:hypothetical protein CHS0354_010454 [Potamilus streckersoni]|uniref:Nucleotide-diphospho-sugar transferase domain-containing protein n=1 Tax=Potamilus streckersoni TaxID=2493646 RepID=A0AAE0VII6_9BIVA|nr:hypothetical protein CHS0354_010454 [Potamilus streckersoni]